MPSKYINSVKEDIMFCHATLQSRHWIDGYAMYSTKSKEYRDKTALPHTTAESQQVSGWNHKFDPQGLFLNKV